MCGMYNEQILFSDKVQSMHRNGFVRPKPTTALSCPMSIAQSKSSNKMMAMHCMYRLREDCLQLSYSPDHVTSLQCTTCFKSNQQPTWTLYMYKWCKSMQRNAGFGTCTILSTRKRRHDKTAHKKRMHSKNTKNALTQKQPLKYQSISACLLFAIQAACISDKDSIATYSIEIHSQYCRMHQTALLNYAGLKIMATKMHHIEIFTTHY